VTDLIFFVIFSEWFTVHSSKISRTDDSGMTGIFMVSLFLSYVANFNKRIYAFLN